MPTLEEFREELRQAADALARLELELDEVRARLVDARSAASAVDLAALTADEEIVLEQIELARQSLSTGRANLLSGGIGSLATNTFALLDPGLPILFLPVRLETRFAYQLPTGELSFADPLTPSAELMLLVRVFPDEIHEVSHEHGLTAVEEDLAITYWQTVWRRPGNREVDLRVWSQIVARAGPSRAAWIVKALEPTNIAQRPTSIPPGPGESDAPLFARPSRHPASWSRPSHADCLPDYWRIIAYYRGQRLTRDSQLIQDPLFTGPDPAALSIATSDQEPGIDMGMRWMVDFSEAERVGMAVRLPLRSMAIGPVDPMNDGIGLLLAIGVRATLGPAASIQRLETLIDSHHYTRGVSFLAQRTPTNNAPDSRSGYDRRREESAAESWEVERGRPLCDEVGDGDGTHAARALGVSTRIFAHIRRADATEQRDVRNMQTALWPVTLGFWAKEMMAFSTAGIEAARRYFIDYVRARGPIPALRVGQQPYGVLPVTLSSPPEPGVGFTYELPGFLDRVRPVWEEASRTRVPTVAGGADPDQTLVEILRHHGATRAYSLRVLMGPQIVNTLQGWLNGSLSDPNLRQQWAELTRRILTDLGLPWETVLVDYVYFPESIPVTAPLVQPIDAADTSPDHPRNYLEWLGGIPIDRILTEAFPIPGKPTPLLYALLRQSLLRAYDAVAVQLLSQTLGSNPADWQEHELIDFAGARTSTAIRRLAEPYQGTTLGKYIELITSPTTPEERALRELRVSLRLLPRAPAEVLEQALTETLDLASHRLDAWITSVATRRLSAIRVARRDGIQLGGYGWVENLRPTAVLTAVTTAVPNEDQEPLYTDADNAGFVHAPSLAHAATAAVLRSGHLAHAPSIQGAAHPLAIELTSDRVRLALQLLEGVRQGQPLGALLGYRFERALHEYKLHSLILNFRELAPLTADRLHKTTASANASVRTIAANMVVDGLQILRLGTTAQEMPWGISPLPAAPTQTKMNQVTDALHQMAGAVDALSDLVMAESVFHAVRGNPLRAAAATDSAAGTGVLPMEMEVIRSARSGIGLTHRLLVLCPEPVPPRSSWPTLTSPSPRAAAEPRLNDWVGSLLGDPTRIKCRAEFVDNTTGTRTATSITLGDAISGGLPAMQIGALDFVYAAVAAAPGDPAQRSELEARLLEYLETVRATLSPAPAEGASPVLSYERDPTWGAADIGLVESVELARAIRELLGESRALRPVDLAMPGPPESLASVDFDDLAERADDAMAALRLAASHLTSGTPHHADLRQILFDLSRFGVQGASPGHRLASETEELATLKLQADSIGREMARREDDWQRLTSALPGAKNDAERLRLHLDRFAVVFGREFRVLPQFSAPGSADIAASLADTLALQGDDPAAARTWLQRTSRVRPGAARLRGVLSYADALASMSGAWAGPVLLQVAQLPYVAGDRWGALPLSPNTQLPGGRLSLVICGSASPAGSVAGLAVDEWVEVIPGRSETTAVSFHYDAPGAAAPHAMLLAVPPPNTTSWDDAMLEAMVSEALAIAKLRAVDGQALDRVGQYLPAVFLAHNVDNETITMDVNRLVQT